MSFVYMQVILHESTDNTEDICNFREKIQIFQKINIPVARFNSSGTPLFLVNGMFYLLKVVCVYFLYCDTLKKKVSTTVGTFTLNIIYPWKRMEPFI